MRELWDLYNEKREKTGEVLQRGKPIPQGCYHLVVSAWIVNSQGQYLLSKRHPDKPYPLYWECTGGSVLAGESSLEGAVREIKEELGISPDPAEAKLIFQTRRDRMQDFYDVWLFHGDMDIAEVKLQKSEAVDAKWADRSTLFEMFRAGKLHPLLDYITDIL